MADYTTNYNLKKPAQEEFYNVDDFNGNMDILDAQIPTEIQGVKDWAVGTFSNTNLLINGGFDIWQRGTSVYVSGSTGKYTADRWRITHFEGGTATKGSNGWFEFYTNASALSSFYMEQKNETPNQLKGKNATFSFECGSEYVYFKIMSSTDGTTWTDATSYKKATINAINATTGTIPTDSNFIDIVFLKSTSHDLTLGAVIRVRNMKLEPGLVATPFASRPYGEELALCQRFYCPIFFTPRRMTVYTGSDVQAHIEYDSLNMRTVPTIVNSNLSNVAVCNMLNGTVISGFTISIILYGSFIKVVGTKTSHGLTDVNFGVVDSYLPLCYLDAEIY